MSDAPVFTCPRCSTVSAHPKDVAESYCGHCHDWIDEDGDLASTAPLFSRTFELADQVAAQLTPQDTERALARILRRVQEEQ